ncbi:hypothetical protein MPTK1_6g08560 [Marchantia polymorpha subsp. ruderalis]|uniref:Uncharacterized protein n=2 Tax=Marchantia polymorpha TaxID=3197 RepID=A0AAF6BPX8_MARPO|nr:hypothetical protein MARPO_0060s0065 [Marchantia polymorpha]BBN14062.1 hypothetical protein Mp_6g08560 [Marchantia polymorpha subsp. ruderalis]|eukprot:PTQ36983.1 hypothetical protein MARPO_0060s0065 [Marchantia polymorpha]
MHLCRSRYRASPRDPGRLKSGTLRRAVEFSAGQCRIWRRSRARAWSTSSRVPFCPAIKREILLEWACESGTGDETASKTSMWCSPIVPRRYHPRFAEHSSTEAFDLTSVVFHLHLRVAHPDIPTNIYREFARFCSFPFGIVHDLSRITTILRTNSHWFVANF